MIYSAVRLLPPQIAPAVSGLSVGDFTVVPGSAVTGGSLTQSGENVVLTAGTGAEWPVAAWQAATADVRVTARMSFANVPNEAANKFIGVITRGSLNGSTINGYFHGIRTRDGQVQQHGIREFFVGDDTVAPAILSAQDAPADAGAGYFSGDFWIKAEAQGTALRIKVWRASSSEPASFVATTDGSYTSGNVGIVGCAGLASSAEITLKSFLVEAL